MNIAIKNLNEVIKKREQMIEDIIYWKHNPKFGQWDALEKRYNNKSFAYLQKAHSELNKY